MEPSEEFAPDDYAETLPHNYEYIAPPSPAQKVSVQEYLQEKVRVLSSSAMANLHSAMAYSSQLEPRSLFSSMLRKDGVEFALTPQQIRLLAVALTLVVLFFPVPLFSFLTGGDFTFPNTFLPAACYFWAHPMAETKISTTAQAYLACFPEGSGSWWLFYDAQRKMDDLHTFDGYAWTLSAALTLSFVSHLLSLFYPPLAILALAANFLMRQSAWDVDWHWGYFVSWAAALVNVYWTFQSCAKQNQHQHQHQLQWRKIVYSKRWPWAAWLRSRSKQQKQQHNKQNGQSHEESKKRGLDEDSEGEMDHDE